MEFYEILTARRVALGMNLDALAEKSGVPKGTVAKVMSGHSRNPGIETLKAITYALDLTLEDLDKKGEEPAIGELSENEAEFIRLIDQMTPANRRLIFGIAQLLLKEQEAPPDSPG